MLHISLFSGIGGFDLAAEWAGWTNIVSCEINPFGNKVLNHYWPDAYHHDDIHTLTIEKINEELTKRHGEQWRTDDIVLTGGFPCQPYSLAGKRLGKEDERHLWPEMLRVIREIQPDWIVGENVFGLVNWSDGLVFDEVQTDLEAQGYEVQAFVLPACAADAPHRRDRVWIVAHTNNLRGCEQEKSDKQQRRAKIRTAGEVFGYEKRFTTNTNRDGQQRSNGKNEVNASEGGQYAQRDTINGAGYGDATYAANVGQKQPRNTREWRSGLEDSYSDEKRFSTNSTGNENIRNRQGGLQPELTRFDEQGFTANTNRERRDERNTSAESSEQERQHSEANFERARRNWQDFPTQSPVCSRNDGIPAGLDGITFSKWRNESIKAAGNAIVPQIAYRIFETINSFQNGNG
jgi:DNA (cytosine-5)-methyltransferase 1